MVVTNVVVGMAVAFAISWDGLTLFLTAVACQSLYFRFRGSFGLFDLP